MVIAATHDFKIVENFAHYPPQQTFEIYILYRDKRADGTRLIRFLQMKGMFFNLEPFENLQNLLEPGFGFHRAVPEGFDELLIPALRQPAGQSRQNRRSMTQLNPFGTRRNQVFQIVLNLISYTE
jgi:hypothetical protein